MNRQRIISTVGLWNYLKWLFATKILREKAWIGIGIIKYNGKWIREYIDHEGNYKTVQLK